MKYSIFGLSILSVVYGLDYAWNEWDYLNPRIGLIEKPNSIASALPAKMSKTLPPPFVKDNAYAQYLASVCRNHEFFFECEYRPDDRRRYIRRLFAERERDIRAKYQRENPGH